MRLNEILLESVKLIKVKTDFGLIDVYEDPTPEEIILICGYEAGSLSNKLPLYRSLYDKNHLWIFNADDAEHGDVVASIPNPDEDTLEAGFFSTPYKTTNHDPRIFYEMSGWATKTHYGKLLKKNPRFVRRLVSGEFEVQMKLRKPKKIT